MNMMPTAAAMDQILTRSEVAGLIALASRSVAPLWPLESAIAVNPLAAFEDLPFAEAVSKASARFGARGSLPIPVWRRLLHAGRIDPQLLRDAAIARLGTIYRALATVAPELSTLDLLMARLLDIETAEQPEQLGKLAPDAAFIAKWCGAYFDQGLAASPMPYRELGLYRAVLAMAGRDGDFRRLAGKTGAELLLAVPRDPLEAIAEGLALCTRDEDHIDHLENLVARLPGWAGHIRWLREHADPVTTSEPATSMADLLALWFLIKRAGCLSERPQPSGKVDAVPALARHFGFDAASLDDRQAERLGEIAAMPNDELGAIFMQAAEWTYANDLVPKIQAAVRSAEPQPKADAQLVFCIDVRSEPFRRALEEQGNYETFGYAGFFGLPIALHPFREDRRRKLLPVLLSPQHDVEERGVPGREQEVADLEAVTARDAKAAQVFGAAKLGTSTAFATAEAMGPLGALAMVARTLTPKVMRRASSAFRPDRNRALRPGTDGAADAGKAVPFTLEDKVGYASALFKLTGLPAETSRLVVLAGHAGCAVNNPYAAALDCGACGGHAGGSNARILAAFLNDPEVRAELAANGVAIPSTTHFLAAEHNTTTDEVTLFDHGEVPASHHADLQKLTRDLARAAVGNREKRASRLGRAPDDLLTGAAHWGEIRPEWGLAGNAGFIVGKREQTRSIDLEGRAFLHSYDWEKDADGSALTTILTAPMVVAQWINCQYLFSTIDNRHYGAGDKTTHNVIGGIGVVQGNGGDLRIGLPRQSLFADDGTPFHVPQRLLTVVVAPPGRVQAIVESNDLLSRLFDNDWVRLVVVDPENGKARKWRSQATAPAEGAALLSVNS